MKFTTRLQDGTRAFMEFERRGDRLALKSHGFAKRFVSNGCVQPSQQQQATESPLIHDGGQNTLSTLQDARNSTVTGSTLAGPNGSGQYLAICFSTLATVRTVSICSTTFGANGSSVAAFYGILQNKPGPGQAADIGIFGISKALAGATTIVPGSLLQTSSTLAGAVALFAGGNGRPIGFALEGVTAAGQVITMFLSGGAANAAST